jgi:alkylated DNA repair dioxygenase AlkB
MHLFTALKESLVWKADQIFVFGKKVTTQRKMAWVGDEGCVYNYSGFEHFPQPWTQELLCVKNKIEDMAGCQFNSCLLNLYHNGNEGMGWHSDDEKELDDQTPIASLSLGGRRKFAFRHKKDKTTLSLFLQNGSLLLMHSPTQQYWLHSLLKTKTEVAPRINLTFRKIILNDQS